MLAERHAGWPIWIDAQGHDCGAGCATCFPGACSEDIPYSSISTGFDGYQPTFDLSQAMQERWNAAQGESGDGSGDKGQGDGGSEPPPEDDQRDGEGEGAGAKLTLFVDVAAKETGKLRA